mmetsp:Transcript_28165/g.55153  ORF Transcript_28165/g.55153 Transcript_28165/m.55153 type:complete len:140 (-) Transcript_28165:1182-1601(-)
MSSTMTVVLWILIRSENAPMEMKKRCFTRVNKSLSDWVGGKTMREQARLADRSNGSSVSLSTTCGRTEGHCFPFLPQPLPPTQNIHACMKQDKVSNVQLKKHTNTTTYRGCVEYHFTYAASHVCTVQQGKSRCFFLPVT